MHNDSARRAATGEPQAGFGLVGLAERVTALAGEISTGPQADGSYEVRAVLPVNGPVEMHG